LSWVRAHTRLLTRAIEWNANGRNNSFVLRGDDLRSAERWLAEAGTQKERQPTALQTEYIIASRKAAARRQRITLGAVTFGFVVAIVLAVLAIWKAVEANRQRAEAVRQRDTAIARQLAAKAELLADRGQDAHATELAASLAVESWKRLHNAVATEVARKLAAVLPSARIAHEGAVSRVVFSPN